MKPYLFSIIAAAACGLVQAQTTAYTVPVGYITMNVPANADTTIAPGLTRPQVYSGASTSVSGDDIGASGLTADAFASPACYLKVTSGSLEGMIFPITSNTASVITVDAGASTIQSLGFSTENTFQVIPYWTLNTLYPNGAGVGGTSDALNPTSFVLVSDYAGTGPNRASGQVFFYCTGDVELDLPAGWYDNADPFAGTVNDAPIDPTIQYIIRSASASEVVVTGEVPSEKQNTEIVVAATTNDNYMAVPFPVDISLQESGLQSVIQATSDALNPTEYVLVYDDLADGFNKGASAVYFYCSGDVELDLPAGWYDNADPFAGVVTTKVLKAGRSFFIRKAAGTPGLLDWIAPLPYTP
jgi:uncharacterized protein (TIGR02597 family)